MIGAKVKNHFAQQEKSVVGLSPNGGHAFGYCMPFSPSGLRFEAVFGPVTKGFAQRSGDVVVVGAASHQVAQVKHTVVVQTGFQSSLSGDAYPVTSPAKASGESSNNTHRPLKFIDAVGG